MILYKTHADVGVTRLVVAGGDESQGPEEDNISHF